MFYAHKVTVATDNEKIETRATMVTISNDPLGGPSIALAPDAKLNDHKSTVKLYRMTKMEITKYLLELLWKGHATSRNIKTYQTGKVSVRSTGSYMVYADAREFGTTPVTFEIIPNALQVITAFRSLALNLF